MGRLQVVSLALVLMLLGGVAYYTSQLSQTDSNLQLEVSHLQTEVSQLQSSLAQSAGQHALDAQQLASIQATLQKEQSDLSNLASEVGSIRSGDATMLAKVTLQLQNISARIDSITAIFHNAMPPIFLRTWGNALASFVERTDELSYLRLTEIGPGSGAEAAVGFQAFNASVAGSSVEWRAIANGIAGDGNHRFWPMVLENNPNGTNAIEFEQSGSFQEVAVVYNGTRTFQQVFWNPNLVHVFKIVIVKPGVEVDFYIDGVRVANLTKGIPAVQFLIQGAEIRGIGNLAPGVAVLDVYGGLLGGT